jgi:SAM-dependent methyltransferase
MKLADVEPTDATSGDRKDASYIVTDLNQPMLDYAATRQVADSRISWGKADALALPFEDAAFDVVCCQFGVMFFPDRQLGYREAKRVLKPGGRFLFNIWDRIEENVFADDVTNALADVFPSDPPRFQLVHRAALIESEDQNDVVVERGAIRARPLVVKVNRRHIRVALGVERDAVGDAIGRRRAQQLRKELPRRHLAQHRMVDQALLVNRQEYRQVSPLNGLEVAMQHVLALHAPTSFSWVLRCRQQQLLRCLGIGQAEIESIGCTAAVAESSHHLHQLSG